MIHRQDKPQLGLLTQVFVSYLFIIAHSAFYSAAVFAQFERIEEEYTRDLELW